MNTKEQGKLACHPNPCSSCPYRKDTPSGVWAREEYLKLPRYDDPNTFAGVFLCHHSTTSQQDTVCRGWVEVHERNLGVRLTMFRIDWDKAGREPTKVPLYRSGAEACRAGLRGVRRPSKAAREMSQKLLKAREAISTK